MQPQGNYQSHSPSTEPCPELSHIAQRVAGDFSVSVSLGKAGGGSYADLEARRIVLDEEFVQDRAQGRFVAAHEGAHLSDTPRFEQLGITKEGVKELVKKIGLFALKNVIEDGAINDRFVRDLPSLKADTLASYPRKGTELGFISHPEVEAAARALGFVPRYARALAALLEDWSELRHEVGFGKSLAHYAKHPYMGAPSGDALIDEFLARSLPEARKAISFIYEPNASAEQKLKAGTERHIWCEQVLYPELEKLLEADLKEYAERQESQNGQGEESQDGQPDSSAERSNTQNQDSKTEKPKTDSSQQQAPSSSDSAQTEGDKSPEEPAQKQSTQEAQRKAREALSAFDDALREALRSACDKQEEAPSTEAVVQEANEVERQKENEQEKSAEFYASSKALREILQRNLTPYQSVFQEVAPHIEDAYGRLVDIFVPRQHFAWQKDLRSGSQINMPRAMQFNATGNGLDKLFMRRLEPERPDMNIALLIDCSGSMQGERITEALRAAVFTKELFQRLGIGCACIPYTTSQQLLIGFQDDIHDEAAQQRFTTSIVAGGGTDDAAAVRFATNQIEAHPSRSKAIVVISDATSADSLLKDAVQKAESSSIPVIHFGIGSCTTDNADAYKRSFPELSTNNGGQRGFFHVFTAQMEALAEELF